MYVNSAPKQMTFPNKVQMRMHLKYELGSVALTCPSPQKTYIGRVRDIAGGLKHHTHHIFWMTVLYGLYNH